MKISKLHFGLGILALGTTVSSAFAQEHVGNGGNAVVCFQPAQAQAILDALTPDSTSPNRDFVSKTIPARFMPYVASIEALDLYEAKNGFQGKAARTPIAIRNGETADQYLERLVSRFDTWLPILRRMVEGGKKMIGDRVAIVDDASLIPVQDIQPLTRAKENCVYTTIAKQDFVGALPIKKLVIDQRFFENRLHSEQSKALLMLHEYVLAYNTYYLKQKNSESTRAIVARMAASDIQFSEMAATIATYIPSSYSYGNFSLVNYTGQIDLPQSSGYWAGLANLITDAQGIQGTYESTAKTKIEAAELAFFIAHRDELPRSLVKKNLRNNSELGAMKLILECKLDRVDFFGTLGHIFDGSGGDTDYKNVLLSDEACAGIEGFRKAAFAVIEVARAQAEQETRSLSEADFILKRNLILNEIQFGRFPEAQKPALREFVSKLNPLQLKNQFKYPTEGNFEYDQVYFIK